MSVSEESKASRDEKKLQTGRQRYYITEKGRKTDRETHQKLRSLQKKARKSITERTTNAFFCSLLLPVQCFVALFCFNVLVRLLLNLLNERKEK